VNRCEALEALKLRIQNEEIIKHSLVVEGIMRKLARYFNEDEELWGLAGLVHDIDLERINNDMRLHGIKGGEILEGLNFEEAIVYAVKAHNPKNNLQRRRKIDKALFCANYMALLIFCCIPLAPQKKLKNVNQDLVLEYFNLKGFARHINREYIMTCNDLGLSVNKFIKLSLEALKENNIM
jgi:putative nucleotidyltransferase with HDIG domain